MRHFKRSGKISRAGLLASAGAFASLAVGHSSLSAQEIDSEVASDNPEQNEIVVTGSFIRRDAGDSASPISIVGRDALEDVGIVNTVDFIRSATINTGSEVNADIFSSGGVTGTAQYNLRGLGLASTLVLVNGRRAPLSSVTAANSLQFVDINTLLPQIAIDRVEILKDGAASLYGSDAVAGVVNNITRDKFVGGEVFFDYRDGQADQRNIQVDGIYGFEIGDSTNIVVSASYFDQTELLASERPFATVSSGVGSPGAFFPLAADGSPVGGPQSDPLCGVVDGTPSSFPGGPGVCSFDLSPFTDLISEDERFIAMVTLRHAFAGGHELSVDVNYAHRETLRTGAPSFPGLRPILVPLTHPRIADAPVFAVPSPPLAQLQFFGRPFGSGFDPIDSLFEDDVFRISAGLSGPISDNWDYDFAVTYGSISGLNSTRNDVLFEELQNAINDGTFNPFATALNGTAPNSQDVIDDIRVEANSFTDTELFVAEGYVTGDLFELPGGTAGLAIGAQFRRNERTVDADENFNNEALFFLVGIADSQGSQNAFSVFAETILPVTDWLEVQAALRYEEYNIDSVGSSLDPKIAVLIKPIDAISLRASFSTAFRAPQVSQLVGEAVAVGGVFDPIAGAVVFPPIRSSGNPNLLPEEADTFNAGITFKPIGGLTFEVDYWRFEYENLISAENATGLVLADPFGPNVIRSPSGALQEVQIDLINAPSLQTDGLDFNIAYQTNIGETDNTFGILFGATHILSYDLVTGPGSDPINLAGFRNTANIGNASPEWRANGTVFLGIGGFNLSATGRFIDSFTNDSPGFEGETINSQLTVDTQVSFNLNELRLVEGRFEPTLTLGAINLFNDDPPLANTSNAFPIATRVHDPRGRIVYLRAGIAF
ncbi:MAG: TonB-dependent receptor [Erythrobacter sp.]